MIDQTQAIAEQSEKLSLSFNELAKLYCAQQKYSEAETLYTRALTIDEQLMGADNPALIPSLSRLGVVYRIQDKYAEAETLYSRALALAEKQYGPHHPQVAVRLNYLAGLAYARGQFVEAHSLVTRSKEIYEGILGERHRSVGLACLSLALILHRLGKCEEADQCFDQFVQICRADADDPMVRLAEMFYLQERYDDVELLLRYTLLIGEEAIWPDHPFVANALYALARWYAAHDNYRQALPLYERVLKITEGLMGQTHPSIEPILKNYAIALSSCERLEEAQEIQERAARIRVDQHFPANVATVIGERYLITKMIGKGGMSTVYQARHQLTNKIVAVKMLNVDLLSDTKSFRRFHLEAKAASALNHNNVVAVHDFGSTADGVPYLVMDYLEGKDLKEIIKETHGLPTQQAIRIFVQCCDALSAAHDQGVVHRDLKPSNIMLTAQGDQTDVVKIVDLGIAKVMPTSGVEALSDLTHTGEVFGSPTYMSPEQSKGAQIDHRSDIYSFGCVMYETLTGVPPFTGSNTLEVLSKHLTEQPVPIALANSKVEHAELFDAIVLRCLAKDPSERFQSMREVKEAIEVLKTATATSPFPAATRRSAAVAKPLIAIAAGVLFLGTLAGIWRMSFTADESSSRASAGSRFSTNPSPAGSGAPPAVLSTLGIKAVEPAAAPTGISTASTRATGDVKTDVTADRTAGVAKVKRMVNIARICHKNGECDKAEVFLKDALKLSEEIFGKESPETRERMRDLALFYQSMDEPEKAAPFLEKILQTKQNAPSSTR